jgi:M6 family metalloprotease-like protein
MKKVFALKLVILFALLLISFSSLQSAFIKDWSQDIKQPDGTVLHCFTSGDEFYSWLHDKDGFTILQDEKTGWYVYADKINGRLITTELKVGRTNPSVNGLTKGLITDRSIIEKDSELFIKARQMPKPQLVKGTDKMLGTNQGTINNIVIYIRFSDDQEFTDNTTTYENMFNAPSSNSMKEYFKEASYNKLTVQTNFFPIPGGTTVVSFQDNRSRAYYQPYSTSNTIGYSGGDNGAQRRDREHILLQNACNAVSSAIPAGLNIDYDSDGYVDNVCFIVYGSPTAWATLLWPHMWSLYSQTVTINGKRVWDYNFQIRSHTLQYGNGVLAHEMFHTLGSPDLYHYSYDGINPVGQWDLMESNANPPQHMGAYMKMKYGQWINSIPLITVAGTYTLNPVTSETNNAFRINSPRSTTEFFIVEYRRKSGQFENSLPGSGLLVYRIDSTLNGNASGPPNEVYLYRPNGTTTQNGIINSANYSVETMRTAINNNTLPKAFLANGSDGDLNIDQIGSAGATISFRVNFPTTDRPQLISPTSGTVEASLKPTFTWSTYAGANSYNFELSETSDFITNVVSLTNYAQTSYTATTDLKLNTVYYWRIKAKVGPNFTQYSDVYSFTTFRGIRITKVSGIFCGGSNIIIDFNASGMFQSGNVLTAQLSDTMGLFNNPINIGVSNYSSSGDGSMGAYLPDTIAVGYHYRIRLVSTLPIIRSSPNDSNLFIISKLNPIIANIEDIVCLDYVSTYYTADLPYLSYKWTAMGGNILGPDNLPTVNIIWDKLGRGWIEVEQTATTGCIVSFQREIDVSVNPVAKFDKADTNVCEGASSFFIANNSNHYRTKFIIEGGKIETIYNSNHIKVNWNAGVSGRVILIQYNAGGCPDTIFAGIHIFPNPIAKITGHDSICGFTQTTYSTVLAADETAEWKLTNGTIIGKSTDNPITIRWNDKGAATLTLIQKNKKSGCETTINKNIYLYPNVKVFIAGVQSACNVKEYRYFTNSYAGDSLKIWSVANGIITKQFNGDSVFVSWDTPGEGILSLVRTNKNGCSDSGFVKVTISETPLTPSISASEGKIVSTADNGNIWFYEDNPIVGEYSKILIPVKNGRYSALVETQDRCKSEMSNYIDFISDVIDAKSKLISVNPLIASKSVNIEVLNTTLTVDNLRITNNLGENVFNSDNLNSQKLFSFDVSSLPNGIYFITMQLRGEFFFSKFIVLH